MTPTKYGFIDSVTDADESIVSFELDILERTPFHAMMVFSLGEAQSRAARSRPVRACGDWLWVLDCGCHRGPDHHRAAQGGNRALAAT